MGFLDSLLKSAIGHTVNRVVDNAVDGAFNNIRGNNYTEQSDCYIVRPQIKGALLPNFMFTRTGVELKLCYELADGVFEGNSGAAEIPIQYIVADSEKEAFADDFNRGLPLIYFGSDSLSGNSYEAKNAYDLTVSNVIGHSLFTRKFGYNINYRERGISHNTVYGFFATDSDRENDEYTTLTLTVPADCRPKLANRAIQTFELIAATLSIENI